MEAKLTAQIHLFGDSAGGTLIETLLLHHKHPHPSVPALLLPEGQLFGSALLVSPGAPFITGTPSMNQSPQKDYVTREAGQALFKIILDSAEPEMEIPNPWYAPSTAPEEWWADLPVGSIDFVIGEDEMLRDDILTWAVHVQVSFASESLLALRLLTPVCYL